MLAGRLVLISTMKYVYSLWFVGSSILIEYIQYSQYHGSQGTGLKETLAVTPENGAPIVVDPLVAQAGIHQDPPNHHNQQEQGKAADLEQEHTTIDPGRPEPGRNIFAGDGENEKAKSDNVGVPSDEGDAKKEISSVNVPAPTTEIKVEGKEGLKGEKEDDRGTQSTEGEGKVTMAMAADGATERKKTPETEKEAEEAEQGEADGKKDRPLVGPHDEAGEEAERVAEELFGDDSDE